MPMCGRYRRTTAEEELARRYHIPIPPQPDLPISWNIAPSQDVLAIRYNPKTKQRSLDALRWGLIPYYFDGTYCLGYCWMAVLFAVGVMNLAWIAALSVFVPVSHSQGILVG